MAYSIFKFSAILDILEIFGSVLVLHICPNYYIKYEILAIGHLRKFDFKRILEWQRERNNGLTINLNITRQGCNYSA